MNRNKYPEAPIGSRPPGAEVEQPKGEIEEERNEIKNKVKITFEDGTEVIQSMEDYKKYNHNLDYFKNYVIEVLRNEIYRRIR